MKRMAVLKTSFTYCGLEGHNWVWVTVLLVAMGAWSSAVPAAEWVFTQGTSGHVQDPAVPHTYYGSGLELNKSSGGGTWVHYAVPSKTYTTGTPAKQWAVRYLRLRFFTGSGDARVKAIHLWDGNNVRFFTLDKPWADAWYGDQDLLVDLGKTWKIYRGLGISLRVEWGVEQLISHQVVIYGVGARWQ